MLKSYFILIKTDNDIAAANIT